MTASVAVLGVRPIDRGQLRAIARVRLAGCVVVHGIKVLQQDDQAPWLAMPSIPIQVHHLTYERVGREDMADLVTICRSAHRRHHLREAA
jgi:DNA-binding cell septation regulator SpoVG